MKRRVSFDTTLAISTAWDVIWKGKLTSRAAGNDYRGDTYRVSASDVEDLVRQFACDSLDGKPWRTSFAPGRGLHWTKSGGKLRMGGNLNRRVIDWLRYGNGGKIVSHNFGRGHISGERYRPAGEPLSPTEAKTLEKKAERKANPRPAPRHFSKSGYGGSPLCVVEAKRAKGRSLCLWRQSRAWVTRKREDVTCVRCLKLLATMPEEAKCEETVE